MPVYDRRWSARPEPAPILRRTRIAAPDHRTAGGTAHADRYLSDIRIPVIGVVWNNTGLPPDRWRPHRTPSSARWTTTVNDIEHIVANSYNGIGIIKIFFQPTSISRPPTRRSPRFRIHAQADAAGRKRRR